MTRSTVTPWEDRLAAAQAEIERDPGKRMLLEYSRLKAKAIAEELAEWRALAAQGTAEGVLRDGVAQWSDSVTGYTTVYSIEVVMLILTLVAMRPLLRNSR